MSTNVGASAPDFTLKDGDGRDWRLSDHRGRVVVLLSRRISEREWVRAVSLLEELGMEEGWMQEYDGASHYYRPDFSDPSTPFKDIRDFRPDGAGD